MKILLDTHAWFWFYLGDPRLSIHARSLIEDPGNDKLVSPASYWELAIKASMGKLLLTERYEEMVEHAIVDNGFTILPVEIRHAAQVSNLHFSSGHKDPFDCLLVAQALVENIPIISVDSALDAYGVQRLW